jgi:predicted helicase
MTVSFLAGHFTPRPVANGRKLSVTKTMVSKPVAKRVRLERSTAADFWTFSKAGRALADWHLNYEMVTPYPVEIETNGPLTDADYRVEKMRYGKNGTFM